MGFLSDWAPRMIACSRMQPLCSSAYCFQYSEKRNYENKSVLSKSVYELLRLYRDEHRRKILRKLLCFHVNNHMLANSNPYFY